MPCVAAAACAVSVRSCSPCRSKRRLCYRRSPAGPRKIEPNDSNRNSVFTRVFVEQLANPGLDLSGLAIEVRDRVGELALRARDRAGNPAPHEQTPAYYDQMIGGHLYLAGLPIPNTAVAPPSVVAVVAPPVQPAVPPAASGPCGGGAVTVSFSSRCAMPLSAAEERVLKPKDVFRECDNCPEMVVVPAGSFTMASPASEPERTKGEAQVRVTIARPFAVGKFAVTFAEWDACVADRGCKGYRPGDQGNRVK
jgi:hypothetical protein